LKTLNSLEAQGEKDTTAWHTDHAVDGDGILESRTAHGVTTQFLTDDGVLNGYPQVLAEVVGGAVVRSYTYGNGRISMTDLTQNRTYYFITDAQGSVRGLMDESGNVTDSQDFAADGLAINHTGTTVCPFGFQGEYTDADTGLVYLRARWMDPQTGRFMGMDSFEGDQEDPLSLHKYLFVKGDGGVNASDPSGNATIFEAGMWAWIALAKHVDASVVAEAGMHVGKSSMKTMPSDVASAQLVAVIFGESGNSSVDEGYAIGATVINRLYYNRTWFGKLKGVRSVYKANTVLDVIAASGGGMFKGYHSPLWYMLMESDNKPKEMAQISSQFSDPLSILQYNAAVDAVENLEGAMPYGEATLNVSALGYRDPISFNQSSSVIDGYGDAKRFPAEAIGILGKHHFAGYKIGSEPK